MDLLQWMGAVRVRDQTADKDNPQVIHMTTVHQLTFYEVKSCMFVIGVIGCDSVGSVCTQPPYNDKDPSVPSWSIKKNIQVLVI